MENSDVIEVNSSDDDAKEPAVKKMKYHSDAMVHIPSKIYDTTITPASNTQKCVNKLIGNKIRHSANVSIQSPQKRKLNGKNIEKSISRPNVHKYINPLNIVSQSSLARNKMLSLSKIEKPQLRGQESKPIALPPSITIIKTKRPSSSSGKNVISSGSYIHVNKNLITDFKKDFSTVTVEIDDKGSQSSTATASPQWYLRPEDQIDEESPEILNNKEPNPTTMIEITIEDSPIKPSLPKEVKKFITIEDSPIKPSNELISDECVVNDQEQTKSPLSKKKLNYPENNEKNVIEKQETETGFEKNKVENLENKENQVNPSNVSEEATVSTTLEPKTDVAKEQNTDNQQNKEKTEVLHTSDQLENKVGENISEFHPIYQKFIDLCFELENSDDMRKIVEKKIKTYYKQVGKEYVESEEFLNMVSVKMSLMKAGPEKMFLYIKDIVDELNIQRKMVKPQAEEKHKEEKITEIYEKDVKHDRKRRRQIRKLEKTIKKLHRAIQKLEQQEVDFDDEENSVYLLTERYKDRLVRVHAKLCKMTNSKMPSEPHINITSRPGQPPGPAKRLEKWINKKVPLGTPLPFPDFHDVLKCVRQANEEDRLGWNEADIMDEARDLFTRCGRKLQKRRQENEWRLATSLVTQQGDPAEENEALKKRLEENRREAVKKEADLVNKFADKQTQLRLEGTEVGDKEAEESPEESEDEEMNDDSNSLDDKSKRKDRLRRLLEEKSKKSAESNKECGVMEADKVYDKIFNDELATKVIKDAEKDDNINKSDTPAILTNSVQNEVEVTESQKNANERTCHADKIGDITEEIGKSDSSNVITSSAESEAQNTVAHNKISDNLATDMTCDAEEIYDITDDINCLDNTTSTSLDQNEAKNANIQNNMDVDTICEAEEDEVIEEIYAPDTPIISKDPVQIESMDTADHNSNNEHNIATEAICGSEITENITEETTNLVRNEPEDAKLQNTMDKDYLATEVICDSEIMKEDITEEATISVQNETKGAKLENSIDKDNLATKVTSDSENEGTQEARIKFEYDEHINLVSDDSDGDEMNLLQKLHSDDDLSSSDCSDADESPIAISDTLKSDSEDYSNENYDVISIENSSYSESESTKDDIFSNIENTKSTKIEVTFNLEDESQEGVPQETADVAINEDHKNYEDSNDNILLASSEDEEDITNKEVLSKYCGNYVNLKDDDITISETQFNVASTNYDINETGDCDMSQTVNNLCDENSSNSIEMSPAPKIYARDTFRKKSL